MSKIYKTIAKTTTDHASFITSKKMYDSSELSPAYPLVEGEGLSPDHGSWTEDSKKCPQYVDLPPPVRRQRGSQITHNTGKEIMLTI